MRYYAGLDVSLEKTAICIVDEVGGIERELRAPSEPDALIDARLADGAHWAQGLFAGLLSASGNGPSWASSAEYRNSRR